MPVIVGSICPYSCDNVARSYLPVCESGLIYRCRPIHAFWFTGPCSLDSLSGSFHPAYHITTFNYWWV